MISILVGDCRDALALMPEKSVQCCVTSPPYFGLRDYGMADQIGLEPTPDAYVAEMVAVFREVRRVLRDDGTLWVNIGDSYSGNGAGFSAQNVPHKAGQENTRRVPSGGCKPKDLIGIPWLLAFALRADGWVLRQEIIWAKPNPMPESVTDRCTKSHESVFLLTKAGWSGPEAGRFGYISDEDARWLALCVDTEGCIVVKRVKHEGRGDTFAPQVSFGSTSRALMDRFVSIVGHGSLAQRAGKNAPMWYWQAANGIAADFLKCIYPHLIVKQRQARIGIHVDAQTCYRGGKTAERKMRSAAETDALLSLWARNKALNHFGDPDISDVPEPRVGRWTAGARYFYDAAAVAENATRSGTTNNATAQNPAYAISRVIDVGETRNKRSVWTIATQPFSGAHFATMPPELAETCIKAGSSERGQCPHCGGPWARQVERTAMVLARSDRTHEMGRTRSSGTMVEPPSSVTTGWAQSCACPAHTPVPQVVLDCFGGAGTTALVADRLQRDATIIELNPAYAALARERINSDGGMFSAVAE